MKVQRVRLPSTNRVTWLVLDDDFVPVQPILAYLQFLSDLDRSPHTVRATAYHLKLFWEYQRDACFSWTEIDVALLARFIPWLRRHDPTVISIEYTSARRTNATIDQILSSVHGLFLLSLLAGVRIETPELLLAGCLVEHEPSGNETRAGRSRQSLPQSGLGPRRRANRRVNGGKNVGTHTHQLKAPRPSSLSHAGGVGQN